VNQGCGEIIIEKIRELLQKNELLMKVSDSYAQLSEQIASQFGGGANPQTSIAALKAKVDNQADQIQEQTGELRENREQIQTLHADKLVLEETVSEQQKSIAQMGNDVERLKADILLEKQSKRDMQQSFVQAANLDKAEHERVLHDLTREFESTQRQSQGLIAKLSSELSSAASRVAEQKLSIARLQKELNATRQEATDRSEEVIALESSRRSECDLLASRERAERDSLISQHESQVRGLREQCETLKMELSHRSGELEHARKDRTQVKEAIGSLKHSKSVLEGRLSALSQHSPQQAKIARKSVSEAVSSTQIHFGQRIEDLTAQFDGERQRIFGFAADQFRSLYNGTEPPDENSYRAVIGDAAKELKRLSDADTAIRRLVGARSKQTTEQAVSNRLAAAH
jgi:chromosome segregation ATPase